MGLLAAITGVMFCSKKGRSFDIQRGYRFSNVLLFFFVIFWENILMHDTFLFPFYSVENLFPFSNIDKNGYQKYTLIGVQDVLQDPRTIDMQMTALLFMHKTLFKTSTSLQLFLSNFSFFENRHIKFWGFFLPKT